MSLPDLLAQLSELGPADLLRVRKTVDLLLGDAGTAPSSWDGYVWSSLCKSLKGRGLRLPHYSSVQASPEKRRKLAEGSEAIRDFLAKAMGQDDDHRLRTALDFVMDVCVKRMERGNAPMSSSVMLNRLPDFPAYVHSAFPGGAASPNQFMMIRRLHSQHRGVT